MKKGTVVASVFESEALQGNMLGDAHIRRVPIYLPPTYGYGEKYPLVLVLAGYSGRGQSMLNVSPWGETMADQLDRLIYAKTIRPMIVAMPDCWTNVGGSQYLDSCMGGHQTYLVEVADFVTETELTNQQWAVIGHSSGGYGALQLGLKYPDRFQYVADHAGDKSFEWCYLPEFPKICSAFKRTFGLRLSSELLRREISAYSKKRWPHWDKKAEPGAKPDRPDFQIMNFIAMCMAYTQPDSYAWDCPIDTYRCELRPEVWAKWLQRDPLHMLSPRMGQHNMLSFKELKFFYMDCGERDEYNLQYCCRQFYEKVRGSREIVYEEFPDGHRGTSYRYERSLQLISEAMSM